MARHTKDLADATVELANETRRAADAAETAAQAATRGVQLELTRREDELHADLRPTEWSAKSGVVLTNRGKGTASDVRVWTWNAAGKQTMESTATGITLGPNETVNGHVLVMDVGNYAGADKELDTGQDGVRATWRNADDSEGHSGWLPYRLRK